MTPAQIFLLSLAWLILLQPEFWTYIVIGAVLVLPVLASIRAILIKSAEIPMDQHLRSAGRSTARHLAQAVLSLTFLPYEAFFSLDAIVRSAGRMHFTHKLLLEWNSSSSSKSNGHSGLVGFYRSMWIAPTVAISMAAYLAFLRTDVFNFVWPLLVSWSLAPAVAWWISLPLDTPKAKLKRGSDDLPAQAFKKDMEVL